MPAGEITISFNGEPRTVVSTTVAELVADLSLGDKRIAVELNREIVSRSAYASTSLSDGDAIEIVQFVGGG